MIVTVTPVAAVNKNRCYTSVINDGNPHMSWHYKSLPPLLRGDSLTTYRSICIVWNKNWYRL